MAQSADPRILAAVQAAHFERWRRRYSRSPVFAPREFELMMPEPAEAIPGLVDSARHSRKLHAGEQRFVSCIATALSRAKSDDSVERVAGASGWRQFREEAERQKIPDEIVDNSGKIKDPLSVETRFGLGDVGRCHCAAAHFLAQDPDGTSANPYRAVERSPVVRHRSNLSFDPESLVSEAREYVVLRADFEGARAVIEAAKPPNWAKSDDGIEDFFTSSVAMKSSDLPPPPDDELKPHEKLPPSFFLRETVAWQLNRDFTGASDIMLKISEYEEKDGSEDGGVVSLKFDYRLRQCIETQLFVARSPGGIGVDDGGTRILWVPDDQGSANGLLYIYASKKLRVEATREILPQQALLLNMLAPATLSILMQRLAFDGPLDLVSKRRTIDQRSPTDARDSGPPPAESKTRQIGAQQNCQMPPKSATG